MPLNLPYQNNTRLDRISGYRPLVPTAARNYSGNGSPEGVVTAEPGSFYTDVTDPTAPQTYVKSEGSGNTGWVG